MLLHTKSLIAILRSIIEITENGDRLFHLVEKVFETFAENHNLSKAYAKTGKNRRRKCSRCRVEFDTK